MIKRQQGNRYGSFGRARRATSGENAPGSGYRHLGSGNTACPTAESSNASLDARCSCKNACPPSVIASLPCSVLLTSPLLGVTSNPVETLTFPLEVWFAMLLSSLQCLLQCAALKQAPAVDLAELLPHNGAGDTDTLMVMVGSPVTPASVF